MKIKLNIRQFSCFSKRCFFFYLFAARVLIGHTDAFSQSKKVLKKLRQQYLIANIKLSDSNPMDSLIMTWNHDVNTPIDKQYRCVGQDNNGVFHFKVPVGKSSGTFRIERNIPYKKTATRGGYGSIVGTDLMDGDLNWCAGDSVNIIMNKRSKKINGKWGAYSYYFKGKGSPKYSALIATDSAYWSDPIVNIGGYNIGPDLKYKRARHQNVLRAIATLNNYRQILTIPDYNVIKADYWFEDAWLVKDMIFNYFKNNLLSAPGDSVNLFLRTINSNEVTYQKAAKISTRDLAKSQIALKYFLMLQEVYFGIIHRHSDFFAFDSDSVYYRVKNSNKGILRDAIIAFALYNRELSVKDYNKIFADASNTIKDTFYQSQINRIFEYSKKGTKVYNFRLPDEVGIYHTLHEYKGKTVVIDVWFTGCTACWQLNKNVLTPVEEYFKNDGNIVFLSICIDISKQNWLKTLADGNYTGPKCVKLYTDGQGADNAFIESIGTNSFPILIVLDKEGRIFKYGSQDLYDKDQLTDILKRALAES